MTGNQGAARHAAAGCRWWWSSFKRWHARCDDPFRSSSSFTGSEEDVVAAIEAGDLKARKLGNAYRISKKSLEDFLGG